jgi:transcriptional regulator with XRE-family HTH domain
MGIYQSNFSAEFSKILAKSGVTCYQIAQYAHLDQSYLSRLKNGDKKNPSPETITRVSLAICCFGRDVRLSDIEELFNSVGRSVYSTRDRY